MWKLNKHRQAKDQSLPGAHEGLQGVAVIVMFFTQFD